MAETVKKPIEIKKGILAIAVGEDDFIKINSKGSITIIETKSRAQKRKR